MTISEGIVPPFPQLILPSEGPCHDCDSLLQAARSYLCYLACIDCFREERDEAGELGQHLPVESLLHSETHPKDHPRGHSSPFPPADPAIRRSLS